MTRIKFVTHKNISPEFLTGKMVDHFIFRLIPYIKIIFQTPCLSSKVFAISGRFHTISLKVSLARAMCEAYCNFLTSQTKNKANQVVPYPIFCISHFLYIILSTLLVISVFLYKIHCLIQDNSHVYPELLQSLLSLRTRTGMFGNPVQWHGLLIQRVLLCFFSHVRKFKDVKSDSNCAKYSWDVAPCRPNMRDF
jgi:hypothetical protein